MKKQVSILKLLGVFFLVCMVILSQNCKQESAAKNTLKAAAMVALEISFSKEFTISTLLFEKFMSLFAKLEITPPVI